MRNEGCSSRLNHHLVESKNLSQFIDLLVFVFVYFCQVCLLVGCLPFCLSQDAKDMVSAELLSSLCPFVCKFLPISASVCLARKKFSQIFLLPAVLLVFTA